MSQKEKCRNTIVLGILILFIGMSVNPLSVALQDSKHVTEINGNSPPLMPIFLGPTEGFVGEACSYTINSTDPDGDEISYEVHWGDFTIIFSVNLTSGTEIVRNHTWYEKGTYTLKAKARDIYGAESDWAILELQIYDTIYVDDDNTAGPWNGTLEHPYQYIQDGVDAADSIDTVFVYNGTYYENIVINKDNINLIGEDKNTTIIDGGGIGDVVVIHDDFVKISGFTIQNCSGAPDKNAGVYITSSNNEISHNVITQNNKDGIFVNEGSYNTICSNILTNNDENTGIEFQRANYNNIYKNDISSNMGGIEIFSSSNNSIYENNITANQHGIDLYNSPNNSIVENDIIDNYHGIYLFYSSQEFGFSSYNIISENKIKKLNLIRN